MNTPYYIICIKGRQIQDTPSLEQPGVVVPGTVIINSGEQSDECLLHRSSPSGGYMNQLIALNRNKQGTSLIKDVYAKSSTSMS